MTIRDSISLSKTWWAFVLLLLVCVRLSAQTSTSYNQKSSTYSSGSGSKQSTTYKLQGTLGQSFTGSTNSTGYNLQIGFGANLINQSFDLTLANLTLNPSTVVRGGDITAFLTVRNIGTAAVESNVTVTGYLSLNPTYENTDRQILTAQNVAASLAASVDLPLTGGIKITIPSDAAAGSYYIVLVVATSGVKVESNLNNNTISSSLSVVTSDDTAPPTITPLVSGVFSDGLNVSENSFSYILRPITPEP